MDSPAPAFHNETPPDLEEYVPLSSLAVVTFVLALLTPVAYLVWGLTLACWVPIVMGLIASYQIRRATRPVKGRMLATWGIGIAMFVFASANVAHGAVRAHLVSEADAKFQTWLQYITDGQLYEAMELQRQYADRQMPGIDLKALYLEGKEISENMEAPKFEGLPRPIALGMATAYDEMRVFFESKPAMFMKGYPDSFQAKLQRCESIEFRPPDTSVWLVYQGEFDDNGIRREFFFVVEMMRSRYKGGEYHWLMAEMYMLDRDD